MSSPQSIIAANYRDVLQRMRQAAEKVGRHAHEVTLVGITKYVQPDLIRPLIDAGCLHLGESRPQAIWQRAPNFPAHVQWHLVGHLQRNKIARTLPWAKYVHSLDSLRLLSAVGEAVRQSEAVDCRFLLEVNLSGEVQKHGFRPDQMPEVVDCLASYPEVTVVGLMGMSAFDAPADEVRRQFSSLRELRDQLEPRVPAHVTLRELSMGMSGDFEIAIEEGSTLVRIGTSLFGERPRRAEPPE